MNKIKQNKITFSLILLIIIIIFSSLTILSLPVLFNYESKVAKIEKNFYKNFKIYLVSDGEVSYKPFPRPHLLLENASLNLSQTNTGGEFINTSNLKVFISLRDLYLRSFNNLISTEIANTNLEIKISDLKRIRNHLYQKVNKPIIFKNCKIFLQNKTKEVILITPIKKILYKINNKTKNKNFIINGKIFGLDFKSEWKRNYDVPLKSFHNINLFNPNIEIVNMIEFENNKKFKGNHKIDFVQDKLEYDLYFDNNVIKISSPNIDKTNFNLESKIQLKPFFFEGELNIKEKKVEKIIDIFLLKILSYDKSYLGNFNGNFKIKFKDLNNKLIKNGEIDFVISEKNISIKNSKFQLGEIGYIETNISFFEENGDVQFSSKNRLFIEDHIEFAKNFQIGSNKIKKIKQIYFDLEKNIGESEFIIKNVRINNLKNVNNDSEIYLVKNIQNLRSHIRKVVD